MSQVVFKFSFIGLGRKSKNRLIKQSEFGILKTTESPSETSREFLIKSVQKNLKLNSLVSSKNFRSLFDWFVFKSQIKRL